MLLVWGLYTPSENCENSENVMGCWGVGWAPPVKIVNIVKIVKMGWAALVCVLCTPSENCENSK